MQSPRREIKLVVRTHGEPASVMPDVREAVKELDPHLPLGDVRTMAQVKQLTLAGRTEPTWVIGTFAVIAVAARGARASTGCCRTRSTSAAARSASAWRSAPARRTCSRTCCAMR